MDSSRPWGLVRRPVRAVLAGLAILAIGSVAWPTRRGPESAADPAAGLDVRTPVPAHVMSTLRRACFDCHSNDTRWPWYSRLPVASQLIERDVKAGRGQLNFSLWTEYNPFDRAGMLDRVCEMATTRAMAPWPYRLLHSEARLSAVDVAALCAWTEIEATRLVEGGS